MIHSNTVGGYLSKLGRSSGSQQTNFSAKPVKDFKDDEYYSFHSEMGLYYPNPSDSLPVARNMDDIHKNPDAVIFKVKGSDVDTLSKQYGEYMKQLDDEDEKTDFSGNEIDPKKYYLMITTDGGDMVIGPFDTREEADKHPSANGEIGWSVQGNDIEDFEEFDIISPSDAITKKIVPVSFSGKSKINPDRYYILRGNMVVGITSGLYSKDAAETELSYQNTFPGEKCKIFKGSEILDWDLTFEEKKDFSAKAINPERFYILYPGADSKNLVSDDIAESFGDKDSALHWISKENEDRENESGYEPYKDSDVVKGSDISVSTNFAASDDPHYVLNVLLGEIASGGFVDSASLKTIIAKDPDFFTTPKVSESMKIIRDLYQEKKKIVEEFRAKGIKARELFEEALSDKYETSNIFKVASKLKE